MLAVEELGAQPIVGTPDRAASTTNAAKARKQQNKLIRYQRRLAGLQLDAAIRDISEMQLRVRAGTEFSIEAECASALRSLFRRSPIFAADARMLDDDNIGVGLMI